MANQNTIRKYREIRDIYRKLSKKYRSDRTMEFLYINYFIDKTHVYNIIQAVDENPVENPSLIHQTVMRDDFHL